MRNLFTALAMGLVMLFVACETESEGEALKHLNITSDTTIKVEAEGGNVAITYSINKSII